MNTRQIANLMRFIGKKSTVAAIVTKTGMTRQTIYKALRALEASKIVRITHWKCDDTGRAVAPVWGFGGEPSEIKPRLTNAEKQRQYRERQKPGYKVVTAMLSQAKGAREKGGGQ